MLFTSLLIDKSYLSCFGENFLDFHKLLRINPHYQQKWVGQNSAYLSVLSMNWGQARYYSLDEVIFKADSHQMVKIPIVNTHSFES
jgi:hypothetical protein